jgi:endonuclease YncB( thermonuclease family)
VRELLGGVARIELLLLPGRDRYDRLLGRLIVNGTDVGNTLIAEGLARAYDGGRQLGWC